MNKLIDAYYENEPAVLCTAGSYVITANHRARSEVADLSEGERLFDCMNAVDVLKYEALFNSLCRCVKIRFDLADFHGYSKATVYFDNIMKKRFAVVILSADSSEGEEDSYFVLAEESCEEIDNTTDFARVLAENTEELSSVDTEKVLVDLRLECIEAVDRLSKSNFTESKLIFSENREMMGYNAAPARVAQSSIIQMLMLAVTVMGGLSSNKRIEIKLCRYSEMLEVRVFTHTNSIGGPLSGIEAFQNAFPEYKNSLSLCRFIAGTCDCGFDIFYTDSEKKLTLSIGFCEREYDIVDFKSRDSLENFEADYAFAEKYICEFLSGNAQ